MQDDPNQAPPRLTEVMSVATLQELQDALTAVTRMTTSILDAEGHPLTRPTNLSRRDDGDALFSSLLVDDDSGLYHLYDAPIKVHNRQIGKLMVRPDLLADDITDENALDRTLESLGLSSEAQEELHAAARKTYGTSPGSIVQFINLIASSLGSMGEQQSEMHRRLTEIGLLYRLATMMTGHTEPRHMFNAVAEGIAQTLPAKGVNIRLLEGDGIQQELVSHASYGLSAAYANMGRRSLINKSELAQACLRGELINIADLNTDPRVYYPEDAKRMGLSSMIACRIAYANKPLGTIQAFSGRVGAYDKEHAHLLRAIARLVAATIENTRLATASRASEQLRRNVEVAADIQRRMIPTEGIVLPGFDIAGCYHPSQELGGDFYDFLDPPKGRLGLVLGDVVGKGVPAALLMAGIRTNFRAFAPMFDCVDELMNQCNEAMARDTQPGEFATVFCGHLNQEQNRMDYCSAGHEPALIVRDGEIHELSEGGLILGVIPGLTYGQGSWTFKPGDLMLVHSDGLPDAHNASDVRLGIEPIRELLLKCHAENLTAQQTIDRMLERQHLHAQDHPQTDDTTLMVLRAL